MGRAMKRGMVMKDKNGELIRPLCSVVGLTAWDSHYKNG